mmetsp:Transcript_18711/g.61193  ORF Transcript_18711/g.61193 Transcript_18711/m.61193 type:complete len:203 (+) Transcript_18711:485-1093(+)
MDSSRSGCRHEGIDERGADGRRRLRAVRPGSLRHLARVQGQPVSRGPGQVTRSTRCWHGRDRHRTPIDQHHLAREALVVVPGDPLHRVVGQVGDINQKLDPPTDHAQAHAVRFGDHMVILPGHAGSLPEGAPAGCTAQVRRRRRNGPRQQVGDLLLQIERLERQRSVLHLNLLAHTVAVGDCRIHQLEDKLVLLRIPPLARR